MYKKLNYKNLNFIKAQSDITILTRIQTDMVERTQMPINMVEFNPGKLPSNEYAFKNTIYVGQNDYRMFVEEAGKEPVYVRVKNFVMKLD